MSLEERVLDIINAESDGEPIHRRTIERKIGNVIFYWKENPELAARSIIDELIYKGKIIPVSYDYQKSGYIQTME